MFIKFVIIVIFGFNTLLWDHDAQQYALVFMESISLLQILECEIFYYIKINGHVGCLEHFHHAISYLWADSDTWNQCDILMATIFWLVEFSSRPYGIS